MAETGRRAPLLIAAALLLFGWVIGLHLLGGGRSSRAARADPAAPPRGSDEVALSPIQTGPARERGLLDTAREATAPEQRAASASGPSLSGAVVGLDGAPLPGLELLALVATLDAGGRDPRGSYPPPPGFVGPGPGAALLQARTDAEGRFRFDGLRADLYLIRARTRRDGSHSWWPLLLTPRPVPAGTGGLRLTLDHPHLVVRIEDERGTPWSGAQLDAGAPGDLWPEQPQLVVTPAVADVHLEETHCRRLPGTPLDASTFAFDVAPGLRYAVGLLGGAARWRPVEVEVPDPAGRIEVRVRNAEAAPPGELRVDVRDRGGLPVVMARVRVSDPDSGLPLLEIPSLWRRSRPVSFWLPPGDYLVEAEGTASKDWNHGTVNTPSVHGRAGDRIQVLSGQRTELVSVLPPGARIALKLDYRADAGDRAAATREVGPGATERWLEARVWLLAADRWPVPVNFVYHPETVLMGPVETSLLPAGTALTSEPLPSGRFTLVARLPGGRSAAREVELAEGVTTAVELQIP